MHYKMTFQEELLGMIGKLDYTWYSDIKRLYEKVYDPKIKKAKITIPGYCRGYDPDTGKSCEDEIIYPSIEEYCWQYDFERLRSIGDESPAEGLWASVTIERTIAQYIKELPLADLKECRYSDVDLQKNYLIAYAFSVVKTKITELQEYADDSEYSSVLNYFLFRLRHRLYFHYWNFREKAQRVKNIEDLFLDTRLKMGDTKRPSTPKFNKKEYAMYYYYLIKAGIREPMGGGPGENGKEDALQKLAQKHGFSYKGFQLSFNEVNNHRASDWITGTKQNLKNFEIVIGMLEEYSAAQSIAQNDLKQAELKGDKRGNPIT